jgi:hypothetical protein
MQPRISRKQSGTSTEKSKGLTMDLKKAARQAYVNSLTQDLTDWDKIELQLEELEEISAELEEKSKALLKSIEAFKKDLDSKQ